MNCCALCLHQMSMSRVCIDLKILSQIARYEEESVLCCWLLICSLIKDLLLTVSMYQLLASGIVCWANRTVCLCQTHNNNRYWLSLHLHIYPLYFVCFQQSIIAGWMIKLLQQINSITDRMLKYNNRDKIDYERIILQ